MSRRPVAGGVSATGRRELASLFSLGQRTVTVEGAASILGIERTTAAKRLAAWAERGWLRRVRRGVYLAVPVDAADPAGWTEDPWYLADLVWSPCYVTGWSAANHWSLTDQVFRSTIVATSQRVRQPEAVLAGSPFLVHHVPADRMEWGLRAEWRHDRRVRVAEPARAVGEMLDVPRLGGGMRQVAEILRAFLDESDPDDALVETLARLDNGAAFKRLGFLVEALGIDVPGVVSACEGHVTSGVSPLDPDGAAGGTTSARWKLRINVEVDA